MSHLVDAGLVRRTVDDDDRRARTVELTEEGRALLVRAYAHIDVLAATTFAEGDDEIVEATRHIERVAAAVVAVHDSPAPPGDQRRPAALRRRASPTADRTADRPRPPDTAPDTCAPPRPREQGTQRLMTSTPADTTAPPGTAGAPHR